MNLCVKIHRTELADYLTQSFGILSLLQEQIFLCVHKSMIVTIVVAVVSG